VEHADPGAAPYSRATSQRLLAILFVLQCLYSASQIAVFTLVALVAVRLSGAEGYAGLPSSILTWGQALSAFPIALLMGRVGRRLGLSFSYAIGALGGLVGVLAIHQEAFPLLLVSAALIGMGRAGSDQSRFVAGELFPDAERARMIGRLVFAGAIGAIVGPVLVTPSSQLVSSWGADPDIGPWVVMFILGGVAALIAMLLLRPDPTAVASALGAERAHSEREAARGPGRGVWKLLMLPHVQLAVVSALVFTTVMVILMSMTPLHMDHHHFGRDSISLVIAVHTLGMFGLAPLTGYLTDRYGRIQMLWLGALTMIAAAIIPQLSSELPVILVGLFLLGLGWNFGYVAATSLLTGTLVGSERMRIQGVNDTLVSVGAGLGTLGAGPLFAVGGFSALGLAGLIMTVALMGLIAWLGRPQLSVADT
jgi:MFS family permease